MKLLFLSDIHGVPSTLEAALKMAEGLNPDRIVLLGGWSLYHPSIEHVLEAYNLENPYPDMIGNERVLLIDSDVERTLAYLQKYYDPEAWAEPVEPLSSQTWLSIYRIYS